MSFFEILYVPVAHTLGDTIENVEKRLFYKIHFFQKKCLPILTSTTKTITLKAKYLFR